MTLLRRRARGRSCSIHGDNGCEIQGEAGRRDRAQDTRSWRRDVSAELKPEDDTANYKETRMTTTDRSWPTREEWEANAEESARQSCYPRERVSDQVADWASNEDRAQLAHVARAARLSAGRVAKLLEKPGTRLAEVQRELTDVRRLLWLCQPVVDRADAAAEEAVEVAVAAEVERRKTDEAWAKELRRRAMIDGEWVL